MVRPGMKRLREAQNIKVQPNKTGTSFMQGQSVYFKKGTKCSTDGTCEQDGILLKKGVVFNSAADTPYNNLANNVVWAPNNADIKKALEDNTCYNQIKQKPFPKNVTTGNIIPKSWNFSWQ